jgi:hypothetical protein
MSDNGKNVSVSLLLILMRHSACLRRSIEYCFLSSQPTTSGNEMGYFKVIFSDLFFCDRFSEPEESRTGVWWRGIRCLV